MLLLIELHSIGDSIQGFDHFKVVEEEPPGRILDFPPLSNFHVFFCYFVLFVLCHF